MYWIFASSGLWKFCIPENDTISLLRIGLGNFFFEGCDNFLVFMLCMINSTRKNFSSFFAFLLFSDITVSSLMALIITVAKKYVRNTVTIYGKFIFFTMFLPTNRWHFFHAMQYQLVYLKNLIECILKKISEINECFF